MSEAEMNAHRLNSGQEPIDEMLALIMREVAEDAKKVMKKLLIGILKICAKR